MQVYSYELLLRRLMLRAPTAAFMALAAFRFSDFAAVDPATGSQMTVPNPFFNAGKAALGGIACAIHSVTRSVTRDADRSVTCSVPHGGTSASLLVPEQISAANTPEALEPCVRMSCGSA
jgi:hypothetical protein